MSNEEEPKGCGIAFESPAHAATAKLHYTIASLFTDCVLGYMKKVILNEGECFLTTDDLVNRKDGGYMHASKATADIPKGVDMLRIKTLDLYTGELRSMTDQESGRYLYLPSVKDEGKAILMDIEADWTRLSSAFSRGRFYKLFSGKDGRTAFENVMDDVWTTIVRKLTAKKVLKKPCMEKTFPCKPTDGASPVYATNMLNTYANAATNVLSAHSCEFVGNASKWSLAVLDAAAELGIDGVTKANKGVNVEAREHVVRAISVGPALFAIRNRLKLYSPTTWIKGWDSRFTFSNYHVPQVPDATRPGHYAFKDEAYGKLLDLAASKYEAAFSSELDKESSYGWSLPVGKVTQVSSVKGFYNKRCTVRTAFTIPRKFKADGFDMKGAFEVLVNHVDKDVALRSATATLHYDVYASTSSLVLPEGVNEDRSSRHKSRMFGTRVKDAGAGKPAEAEGVPAHTPEPEKPATDFVGEVVIDESHVVPDPLLCALAPEKDSGVHEAYARFKGASVVQCGLPSVAPMLGAEQIVGLWSQGARVREDELEEFYAWSIENTSHEVSSVLADGLALRYSVAEMAGYYANGSEPYRNLVEEALWLMESLDRACGRLRLADWVRERAERYMVQEAPDTYLEEVLEGVRTHLASSSGIETFASSSVNYARVSVTLHSGAPAGLLRSTRDMAIPGHLEVHVRCPNPLERRIEVMVRPEAMRPEAGTSVALALNSLHGEFYQGKDQGV